MNMTAREKLLAVIVLVLAVIVGGFALTLTVSGALQSRHGQIAALQNEISNHNRVILQGRRAAERLARYENQSLPPDPDQARSAYHQWLLATTENYFGKDTTVVGPAESAVPGVYHQFSYTISGSCTLAQLTDFLYQFYSINTLHRIRSLSVQPIEDSKQLRLTMVVEALSLPTAPVRDGLNTEPSDRLAFDARMREDYRNSIVRRNLFGPPNQPPRLASLGRQSATTGRPFSVTIRASDPDELDRVSFRLVGQVPEGARLEPLGNGSARLSWTPPKPGRYQLAIEVSDDGLPPRSDSGTLEVVVTDPQPVSTQPEPKKPTFDVAKYTVLVAVLQERDGQPVIWLDEKPTGRRHTLHEGDRFEVGSVKGVVYKIRIQDVVVEVDGKPMLLSKGESLTQARPLAPQGA